MDRVQQYEVWTQADDTGRWDLLASFTEFDAARAVATTRSHRIRLVRVIYEKGQIAESEILAEVCNTREKP